MTLSKGIEFESSTPSSKKKKKTHTHTETKEEIDRTAQKYMQPIPTAGSNCPLDGQVDSILSSRWVVTVLYLLDCEFISNRQIIRLLQCL